MHGKQFVQDSGDFQVARMQYERELVLQNMQENGQERRPPLSAGLTKPPYRQQGVLNRITKERLC